jgi:hypothetical protein
LAWIPTQTRAAGFGWSYLRLWRRAGDCDGWEEISDSEGRNLSG